MKKMNIIIFLIVIFQIFILFPSCNNSVHSNYKNENGYKEYISDSNSGYKDVPYYNVSDSMNNSKAAREYYKNNCRRVFDYLITDYEDGVCINRFFGTQDSYGTITIPETIDGKPVVKLGGYIEGFDMSQNVIGAFGGYVWVNLKIPSSVKVISAEAIMNSKGMIPEDSRYMFVDVFEFIVDENNPYYASKNGSLYTKDFKNLLWVNTAGSNLTNPEWENNGYTVPNFVETFEPSNGVHFLLERIIIGKNVKNINTYIDKGENGPQDEVEVIVLGYKGSVAEKWAKEQHAKFKLLDD